MNILGDNGRPDWEKYLTALVADTIQIRNRVIVFDRNEKVLGELTANSKVFVMDGAVQLDATQSVTRSLSLLLLDPWRVMFFEPGVVSETALFMDRSIQVIREVFVPTIGSTGKWVGAPIFTGPITNLDQDGLFTTVEAQGKESLLLPPHRHWRSRTFPKNTRVTTVIRTLLQDKGETKIILPQSNRRLHKALSVVPSANTWAIINTLAKSANMHCFYDGEGRFRMRRKPNNVSYRFRYGVDMLSRPSKPYDFIGVRNIAQIRGPRPDQKGEKQIVETRRLHPNHPMSPESLARNGSRRFIVEIIQNDNLKTRVRAREQGDRTLKNATSFANEYGFETLVIPFLDEYDVVSADTEIGDWRFALTKCTIPFGVEDLMSINFNKRIRMRTRLRPKKRSGSGSGGRSRALPSPR